jgi:hypothetical protein
MAISIPAILDTQIANLREDLDPHVTAATNTAASSSPPMVRINRIADLLDELLGLIDSGTLTATTGSETDGFTDSGAFTGVNSLIGATFTYAADTTTVALRGVSRPIISNTVNKVVWAEAATANQVGDTGTIEFTTVDDKIAVCRQGKGLGDSGSNPYGNGPALAGAILMVLEQLGAIQESLDTGTTDGAGDNDTIVDSGGGWTVNAWTDLWVSADDSGTLDVDNLRRIATNTATDINVYNAFTNAAGTGTTPGASTVYAVLDQQIYSGTAAAGAATSLTCPTSISFAANELIGLQLVITSGTGAGQRRVVTGNTAGVSSVISVGTAWATNPDATSVFQLQLNTMPNYLVESMVSSAEPFGLLSPHGGGSGAHGHAGASLMGDMIEYVRNVVAGYTAPA